MNYFLNSEELESILLFHLNNKIIENEFVDLLHNNSRAWDDKLICLTLSFARILERRRDSLSDAQAMIQNFFSFPDKMFFCIQECDANFVDNMLKYEHIGAVDLETLLQAVSINLSEYRYEN